MIHRSFFYLFSLIAAGMLLVACGGAEPAPTPTATPQPAQPTFTPTTAPQAPAATLATPAAAQTPSAPAAFALPAPLYYIDRASGQIMRMERDATTVTQLTNEGASITAFDVAPVSGDLVYVTNNSLVQTDARGGNRVVKLQGPSLIDDGSPNPFPGVFVRAPRFSPDGQSIVFGVGNLYLMAAGPTTDYQTLIPAVVETWGTQEFWPASWSTDGQRLLVYGSAGGPPVSFLYTLAAGTTLPLQSPIQDHIVWGADGRALYASGASLGFIYDLEAGLARIDAHGLNMPMGGEHILGHGATSQITKYHTKPRERRSQSRGRYLHGSQGQRWRSLPQGGVSLTPSVPTSLAGGPAHGTDWG